MYMLTYSIEVWVNLKKGRGRGEEYKPLTVIRIILRFLWEPCLRK